jgi:hypothetical protein
MRLWWIKAEMEINLIGLKGNQLVTKHLQMKNTLNLKRRWETKIQIKYFREIILLLLLITAKKESNQKVVSE